MKKLFILFLLLLFSTPIYAPIDVSNPPEGVKIGSAKFISGGYKLGIISPEALGIKNETSRYQIFEGVSIAGGGSSFKFPIILDTATGRTWQYFLDVNAKEGAPSKGWVELRYY